jgi:glutamate-1-semialdehyde 2,1-aminomutase
MLKCYSSSEELLSRALKTIPLGTQTYSKSKTHYPLGVSPYFITKGKGSHVWDIDGNEYIDFVNALTAITLGYNDPDVNAAVLTQMEDGSIFSLPHPIEVRAAEKIVEMVPCAEMVRFGKNGSDATSAAVRLARAYTGRDRVARCGYHGWHDWYIGSTSKHRGIPKAVRDLTHSFTYNNLDSLHQLFQQYPEQIAAVILEPMNVVEPLPDFLENLKEITHRHGAILIFDETITGFRFAKGGAQEYFGVIPDLATFGKGLANGYPLSALVGRADIMKLMEEVFFSFTFGGETLSLAAALATMTKLQQEPVIETMKQQGQKVITGAKTLIERNGISHILSVSGHPVWSFLLFKDSSPYNSYQIKTLFLQEAFARGILTIGSHNLSYAHSDADVEQLLGVYDEVFAILQDAVDNGLLEQYLRCEPLEPLFKGMSRN